MKKTFIALFFCIILLPKHSFAFDISGYASIDARYFFYEPLYAGQKKESAGGAFTADFFFAFTQYSSLTFKPFFRYDSSDRNRTHADLREFLFAYKKDNFDLKIGVGKVFWGVTESRHLVDIINQSDNIESPDGEEKLGEPMVNLTLHEEFGTIDLFVLPYFRERTFPGTGGRLRKEIPIDIKNSTYSSDKKEKQIDLAGRYSIQVGSLDFALSHFYGTSREPEFIYFPPDNTVSPLYRIINQTGIETLYVKGPWMLKLESVYRSQSGAKDFFAATTGFEYTFSGDFLNGKELSGLLEANYDGQYPDLNTPFDKEVMAGIRLSLNDVEGTELLAGYSRDIEKNSANVFLEGSRRLTDYLRLRLEGFIIMEKDIESVMYDLRKDSYIDFAIEYYF